MFNPHSQGEHGLAEVMAHDGHHLRLSSQCVPADRRRS